MMRRWSPRSVYVMWTNKTIQPSNQIEARLFLEQPGIFGGEYCMVENPFAAYKIKAMLP